MPTILFFTSDNNIPVSNLWVIFAENVNKNNQFCQTLKKEYSQKGENL